MRRYFSRKYTATNSQELYKLRTKRHVKCHSNRHLCPGIVTLGIARKLGIMAAAYVNSLELHMENENETGDGVADAIAATAVITLVVVTLYFWLSGMPS